MNKLIRIKPVSLYYDIAEEKIEEGDYLGAIYNYFQSYKTNNDLDSLLALGDTYQEIGELKEALNYLFLAIDRDPYDDEILDLIAHCFMVLGDDEAAFYYIQGDLSPKKYRALISESKTFPSQNPDIHFVSHSDDTMLSIATKLLTAGDIHYAKEMLQTIKPNSKNYVIANNLLAITELEFSRPEAALTYCDKAIEIKDNPESHTHKMRAYYLLGEKEKEEEQSRLIESYILTENEQRVVAISYSQVENAPLAKKHLEKLLEYTPYNNYFLVSYALSLYRCNEESRAKSVIIKASKIYPEDVTIRFLAAAMYRGEVLPLFPVLPEETVTKWQIEIDKTLKSIENDGTKSFDAPEFVEQIEWLFSTKLTSLQMLAANILGIKPFWHEFLQKQLLKIDVEIPVKKSCLYSLLMYAKNKKIGIVIDGLYYSLKIKYPETKNDKVFVAYCLAFSSLAMIESNFETRLFNSAKKLLDKFDKNLKIENDCDETDVAALLFYMAKSKGSLNAKQCANIFDCNEQSFSALIKELGIKK